jgi:DNA primase
MTEGVVIPWFDRGRVTALKVRQPEGAEPKYAEAFRDRPGAFPGLEAIRPGRPVVVVEGELDALLLGQELEGMAAVLTLGSASAKPEPATLEAMLPAARWLIATDADEAGDRAAEAWPARARRVRPPEGKDWTDSARAGVNLRRWWANYLGIPFPPYSGDHLSSMRWEPAAADTAPGISIDRVP